MLQLSTVQAEQAMLKTILKKWAKALGALPTSYLTYDLETTGIDHEEDLIVELGYCKATDCSAKVYHSHVINWLDVPGVDPEWVAHKLDYCQKHMRKNGRTYHMTVDRMKAEGSPPEAVLGRYVKLFDSARQANLLIAGHNAVQFDNPFFERAVREWLGLEKWTFPKFVFDTAAVVKASIVSMPPHPEETLQQYFFRVLDRPAPGVKYNLDTFCVEKFQLLTKYPQLDVANAHTAGFDAMLIHLLLEEFRELNDQDDWNL